MAITSQAQFAQPGTSPYAGAIALSSAPTDYLVVERGPHHRQWGQIYWGRDPSGQMVSATNLVYIELATGMHFIDPQTGQWTESQELIVGFPGGAVARQGQIQMIFANNLATEGAIDAQTPAGRFRSHVLCLSYADTTLQTNIMIAEVQDCQGEIIAPNQVLYSKAFSDNVNASVRYSYRKSGWEQDIIIDDPGSLPIPESLGLDSASPTLTLQVITEFIEPPVPAITSQAITTSDGLTVQDQDLDWGAMRLGHGQALYLGATVNAPAVSTTKRWIVTSDNRHLLVEDVPFATLLKQILSRSQGASLEPRNKPLRRLASLPIGSNSRKLKRDGSAATTTFPRLKPVKPDPKPMQLAVAPPPERGILIDYVTMASSTNNYVFQADTTYYISGLVSLSGTTICEGGTVIKFTNYPTAKMSMSGPLVCKGAQYRPVVLTCRDDSTLGQAVGTGTPTNYNAATYLEDNNNQNNTYQYLRILYAGTGISAANFSNGVWHCQFLKCGTAISASGSGPCTLRNVLIAQCTNAVVTAGTLSAEHLTADQCTTLLSGAGSSGNLTNCLITGVTTLGSVSLYNSANPSSGAGVYQPVGAAGYYLVSGSTNRNAGSTNINSTLLADLRKRTTYPPIVLANDIVTDTTLSPQSQRDTDLPDRGFEYDPLDYVAGGLTITNTLILTNGVALGACASNTVWGLFASGPGYLVSEGSADNLNHIVWYNTVQEQSTTNW